MHLHFDARVIQDHFPGIGRYAYNLLRCLPQALDANDKITVTYDVNAKNTRYSLPIPALNTTEWRSDGPPVFSWRNLAAHAPLTLGNKVGSVAHFPYYLRPLRRRVPSVTTIHDAISFVYPQFVPSVKARWVIRLTHALAIRASDVIIAVSNSAANDIVRFFPSARGKVVTIREAADDFEPATTAQITSIRTKYALPAQFSLYLASNKPHKNLVNLVQAWHILKTKNQEPRSKNQEPRSKNSASDTQHSALSTQHSALNTQHSALNTQHSALNTQHSALNTQHLVIAGHQDPRFPQAQLLAQELGLVEHIKFIGNVPNDDMAALYAACDLFVFPSLYEGFGLTPLEAMACGAAVACSNTSSLPEVVGDAALLFDPNNPQDIANACQRILSDDALRRSLQQRSLAQAKRFTWANTARETAAVYRNLAN